MSIKEKVQAKLAKGKLSPFEGFREQGSERLRSAACLLRDGKPLPKADAEALAAALDAAAMILNEGGEAVPRRAGEAMANELGITIESKQLGRPPMPRTEKNVSKRAHPVFLVLLARRNGLSKKAAMEQVANTQGVSISKLEKLLKKGTDERQSAEDRLAIYDWAIRPLLDLAEHSERMVNTLASAAKAIQRAAKNRETQA